MVDGVFIVGSPRSGTTLLQSIIASHSEYFSPPETSFFDRIIPRMGVRFSDPACRLDSESAQIILRDFALMTGKDPGTDLDVQHYITVKDAFENLLSCFNRENKPKWVEKTTNHATCMLAIRRFYPHAKFVHVIRDPVDSVASMVHLKPTAISDYRISYFTSYLGAARLWKKCVSLALLYPQQENVQHVFFEDLVRNPQTVVKSLCNFLQIPYEDSMLNSFHQTASTLFSVQSCPWQKQNLSSGFNENSVHKWRKRLSQYDLWLIQIYVRKWAHYLGYFEESRASSRLMKAFSLLKDLGKVFMMATRTELLIRKGISRVIK